MNNHVLNVGRLFCLYHSSQDLSILNFIVSD